MTFRTVWPIWLLFLLSLSAKGFKWKGKPKYAVERPLFIGAFNIQNLGNKKLSNETLMQIIRKIILRYDLILIQEIVTRDQSKMCKLLQNLNRLSPTKSKIKMKISKRIGRSKNKEQYAYIYRDDRIKFLRGFTYPDKSDDFERSPFIGLFATPTLRDLNSLIIIGIHTKPTEAFREVNALAKVYDYVTSIFGLTDAIIMGDFNAGCRMLKTSDWKHIELWYRKEFTWLTPHDMDTTLAIPCCPYDRFVIAGENLHKAVVESSIAAFKFREEYGLSEDMAKAISDHWPIEMKLRGRVSDVASSNLEPSICVVVQDFRQKSMPVNILEQKTTFNFSVYITDSEVELYTSSFNKEDIIQRLERFAKRYPQLVSQELVEALEYKVEEGALRDESANADLKYSRYDIVIYFDRERKSTTLHCCVATTLN